MSQGFTPDELLSKIGGLILFIFTFSFLAFPVIPVYLAGGRPPQVRFFIKAEARDDLALAGVPIAEKSVRTEPVNLLAATPDSYIIVPGAGKKAIELRREIVRLVIYQ